MKDDDVIAIRCDACKAKHEVSIPGLATKCKTCGTEGGILHHDPANPTDARRTLCGVCNGKANRIILDRLNGTSGKADSDEEYGRGRRG